MASGMNHSMGRWKKVLIFISVLFFWLLVWQAAAFAVGRELILAGPIAVAKRIGTLALTASFWRTCLMTLARVFAGFFLGMLFGTLCGLLSANRVLHALISPLMTVARCVPVASFIILTWYFLNRDQVPVFAAFIMVVPIVWGNVKKGLDQVDVALREVALVFDFSFWKKLKILYVPSVLPYFVAGCTTSLGLSWKAGIAAEVLCRPSASIGNEIFLSKSYLETVDLFAWTAIVVILSVLIEKLFRFTLRRAGHDSN